MDVTWHQHFPGCCLTREEAEEERPDFEVREAARLADESELTATQKRILAEARDIGFNVRVMSSTTWVFDKIQKEDGKTAKAGEVVTPEHEERHTFMGGVFPKSHLGFKADWINGKFQGSVNDPAGRMVELGMDYEAMKDSPSAQKWGRERNTEYNDGQQMRQTRWHIDGSTEFEKWLDEWRGMIKGETRAVEKARIAEEKARIAEGKARIRQNKIYKKYLDDEGVEYDDSDWN